MMILGQSLSQIIVLVIAVILSMSIHEVAHGLVSYWFGDPTARQAGRLSLNPFAHIDRSGLLCLLLFGFGWAKPVPVDPRYYKDPKAGMIWTAFAGPLANFLLSFVCVFLYYLLLKISPGFALGAAGSFIESVFATTAIISAGFGIFNLIPVPPLDGSKILFAFLPDQTYYRVTRGTPWMSLVFIALLWSGVISGPIAMLRGGMIDAFSTAAMFLLGM